MTRALVLGHEDGNELGRLEGPLRRRRVMVDITRLADMASLPHPRDYDLLITLGSEESAYNESVAWVCAELTYVRTAIARNIPVLGICFGAQMLARALGAEVRRAQLPEVGWKKVERTEASRSWLPVGPWFTWHHDTFDWPPDATPLAWTDAAPHAFRQGGHLGLQFHPEATSIMIDGWLDEGCRELELHGVDVAAVRRETRRIEDAASAAAQALFAVYLDDVLH